MAPPSGQIEYYSLPQLAMMEGHVRGKWTDLMFYIIIKIIATVVGHQGALTRAGTQYCVC